MEDNIMKINFYNNMNASNWKKLGEVYENENRQTMFVCYICIENAKSIDSVYNTSDVSAFCWHIKQQHTTKFTNNETELIKETCAKKLSENLIQSGSDDRIADEGNLKLIKEQLSLKSLEIFHRKLVENFSNKKTVEIHDTLISPNDVNIENNLSVNSNFDNDNLAYTKSVDRNEGIEIGGSESNTTDTCSDMIEISDDDDDADSDIIEMSTDIQSLETAGYFKNQENLLNCGQSNLMPEDYHLNRHSSIPRTQEIVELSQNELFQDEQYINTSTDFNSTAWQNIRRQNYKQLSHSVIEAKKYFKNHTYNTKSKRPFKCKVCGKCTKNEKTMQFHQKRFHSSASNLGTVECEICQKRISVQNLLIHMRVHSNEYDFKCCYCDQRYKHQQSLRIHMLNKHSA